MGPVHIGVGHDDHLVVAQPVEVELIANPGPEGGDDRSQLLVVEELPQPGLLHVEDLPRRGRIAWKFRSRPCLADPPAESPSTMNSSDSSGEPLVQSASFPGRPPPNRASFLRTSFRAFAAASRARWAEASSR